MEKFLCVSGKVSVIKAYKTTYYHIVKRDLVNRSLEENRDFFFFRLHLYDSQIECKSVQTCARGGDCRYMQDI